MAVVLVNLILAVFLVIGVGSNFAAAQAECSPARCSDSGPEIRFPFWLKGQQPPSCGYPRQGFELTCSPTNTTEIDLQYPVKATSKNNLEVFPLKVKFNVRSIDYISQKFGGLYVTGDCLPKTLPATTVNSSDTFPFKLIGSGSNFTIFNCSSINNASNKIISQHGSVVDCLSGGGYQVVALGSYYQVSELILPSCAKMYSISDVDSSILHAPVPPGVDFVDPIGYIDVITYYLWSEPSCGSCEAGGNHCKLKANATDAQTECVGLDGLPPKHEHGPSKKTITKVVVSLSVVLVVSILLYIISTVKRRKDHEKKIEKFLEDYKALRPTRFSYTDIKEITSQFNKKLGEGGYGTVYKGKLFNDVLVAVKVLKVSKGKGDDFINEVGTIGNIHHVNVVRLVGYCADGYNRALVYEFLPNDSLDKVISSRKQINEMGWIKMQEIAIGIAKGLDYLHQGCNQRILHFDIKPQNILLDECFNPKVADFGLAKLCSKEQSVVFMTAARGTVGYIAPEIFSRNFGSVSYKSDVYSFGMLMLDMVGGRKRFQSAEDENSSSEMYFPEWMYNQLEKGGKISIQMDEEKEEDEDEKFKRLAIVGLWCIQWYPVDRPSMKVVLQMLEGENMPIMPPNPFASTTTVTPNQPATSSGSSSSGEISTY